MLAVALGGCGLGKSHKGASTVKLTVTRDFGTHGVDRSVDLKPAPDSTSISLLGGQNEVVRDANGGVQSIGGVRAGAGEQWFQYINGVAADTQSQGTQVYPGDRVWWDLHASDALGASAAVVGSFPEPFLDGQDGKRLPVTLECATNVQSACNKVASALANAGIPVALQGLGTGSGQQTLGVVVGLWTDLRSQLDATLISHGPGASGVFAKFDTRGGAGPQLDLLDRQGTVRQTLGAGSGLVAATRDSQNAPTWLITGTDQAGVLAAAGSLTAHRLHDHFALAVQGGKYIPVPVT